MHGNYYASNWDEKQRRLTKDSWSRFVGVRFGDWRGLQATLNNLP